MTNTATTTQFNPATMFIAIEVDDQPVDYPDEYARRLSADRVALEILGGDETACRVAVQFFMNDNDATPVAEATVTRER